MQFADIGGLKHRTLEVLQDGQQVFVGNQHFGAGVLHHEFQPLRRIGRVQREVCTTGLEGTQRGNHHIFVSAQHNTYHALGGNLGLNVGSKIVRQFVHLAVSQAGVLVNDSDVVRAFLCVLAEEIQYGGDGDTHSFSVCVIQTYIFYLTFFLDMVNFAL